MILVGVTGHQAIPHDALAFVKTGISRVLRDFGDEFTGVSSLAIGADQVFAEAVLRIGGQLHAIIPCERYEMTFDDEQTIERFRQFLDHSTKVEVLKHDRPSEEAFLDAGRRVVELSQLIVAVWDGRESRGRGGTADIVHYARERGLEVVVIWPSGVVR